MNVKQVLIVFAVVTATCVGLAVGRNYYAPLKDATMFLDEPFAAISTAVSETLRGNPLALLSVLGSSVTVLIGVIKLVKDRVISPIKTGQSVLGSEVSAQGNAIYQLRDEANASISALTEQQKTLTDDYASFKAETSTQIVDMKASVASMGTELEKTAAENKALLTDKDTLTTQNVELLKRVAELTPTNSE